MRFKLTQFFLATLKTSENSCNFVDSRWKHLLKQIAENQLTHSKKILLRKWIPVILRILLKSHASQMKPIFIFVLIFGLFELINNVEGQGSPIASIGTYIIKYKERKRKEELRRKQRNKTRKPPKQITYDCFPFFEPCYYRYT